MSLVFYACFSTQVPFYFNTKIFLGFSQIYITCSMILKAD